MNLLDYHPSMFHDYHCPIVRNSFPPLSYAPVQSDWVPVRLVTQSFWGTQSDWVPEKDWDPVGLGTSEGLGSSRTGWAVMTVRQSSSDEWKWCMPTCRVFETRIFVSSNFKKMRKYSFYWWSSFVDLFVIEVFNDFGLVTRIDVFWNKGDPLGTGDQSGTGTGASLLEMWTGVGGKFARSIRICDFCWAKSYSSGLVWQARRRQVVYLHWWNCSATSKSFPSLICDIMKLHGEVSFCQHSYFRFSEKEFFSSWTEEIFSPMNKTSMFQIFFLNLKNIISTTKVFRN